MHEGNNVTSRLLALVYMYIEMPTDDRAFLATCYNSCCAAGACLGEQGLRSGESTLLPPVWLGFDSQTRRQMWVEFCWFSPLLRDVFLRVLPKNQDF